MQADVAAFQPEEALSSAISYQRSSCVKQPTMFSLTRTLILKLWLIHVTLATTFHPNCTIPPEGTRYVAEPNVRSTLSILWNALYTIFVCTWVIQHLNVPPQGPKVHLLKSFLRSFWSQFKWMLATIMLPDYLVGKAFGDYMDVREFKKTKHIRNWTVTHAYYCIPGGFLLEFPSKEEPTAINTAQLLYLLNKNAIDCTPTITEAEIKEKGQGDFFAKLLAVFQLIWLIIQLITRKTLNLPSTKIEITTLSFAVCSLVTYILWFWKPQSPKIPTYISLIRDIDQWDNKSQNEKEKPKECFSQADREKWLYLRLTSLVPASFFTQSLFPSKDIRELAKALPNDIYNWNSELWGLEHGDLQLSGKREFYWSISGEDVGFILGGVILGACHCIAWNFDFPTPIERTLWRVASIIVIAVMPVYYLLWLGNYLSEKRFRYRSIEVDTILAWLAFVIFGVARLYLLGAAFRDLFFLPPEAFITTWAASLPGFG